MTAPASITMTTGNEPTADPAKVPEGVTETPKGVQFGAPKVEAPAETPAADPNRPAWLPEKFKSPEDLAKAYKELEAGRGAPAPKIVSPVKTTDGETTVNFDVITAEFAENGAVSDKSYKAPEKQGLSRAVVDQYIAGQQALAQAHTADLATVTGGQEKLTAVLQWAGKNLSKEEIAGYNSQIDAGNLPAAKLLLEAFARKHTEAVGKDPNLVKGSPAANKGTGSYESMAQVTVDMRNPKYQTDPAFRKMVEQKLANSPNI